MSMSQNMLLSNEDYGLLLSRDFYLMSFIMTEGKNPLPLLLSLSPLHQRRDCWQYQQGEDKTEG